MRRPELEAWVLDVADRVKSGQHVEDSRVELKAEWPKAEGAARRIAGHANASRGDEVLWIIGLDETSGVRGVQAADTAAWWASVRKDFVEVEPPLQDLAVPYDGLTLVALLFDTSAAPFVVRNQVYGKQGAGPVEREVPWRDGTAVRSAQRSDLIRLLVPKLKAPRFDILSASISSESNSNKGREITWNAHLSAYCHGGLRQAFVIPWHQLSGRFTVSTAGFDVTLNSRAQGHEAGKRHFGPAISVATIHTGSDQVIVEGPGMMHFSGYASTPALDGFEEMRGHEGRLQFEWTALDAEQPQRLDLPVYWREREAAPPNGQVADAFWGHWTNGED